MQGFNLNRPDALGNIIAIINETYSTKFESSFEQTEFELLFSTNDIQLGISALNILNVRLEYKPEIKPLEPISEILMENNIEYIISGDMMWSPGLQIQVSENQKVGIIVDGLMIGFYMPILHHMCERNEYTLSAGGQVYFEPTYFLATEGFVRQTALLAETEIKPEIGQYLKYEDVSFQLVSINQGWSSIRLDVHYKDNLITYKWLKDVCQILLEKRVVILDNTRSPMGSSVTSIG